MNLSWLVLKPVTILHTKPISKMEKLINQIGFLARSTSNIVEVSAEFI